MRLMSMLGQKACMWGLLATLILISSGYAAEARGIRCNKESSGTYISIDMKPNEEVLLAVTSSAGRTAFPIAGISIGTEWDSSSCWLTMGINKPESVREEWVLMRGVRVDDFGMMEGRPIPGAIQGTAIDVHHMQIPVDLEGVEIHVFPFRRVDSEAQLFPSRSVDREVQCVLLVIGQSRDAMRRAMKWDKDKSEFDWDQDFVPAKKWMPTFDSRGQVPE